ncbi:MAG TPA: recombinase family protein [Tepidisphaeraceae bacterium]|nr:recombinase family protein [Tepidisphaeraceae bacterium]
MLQVLAICRISTLNQDEQSLEDQEAMYRKWIAGHYAGKVDFHVIKTQGSGEWLDRTEIAEAKTLIATRTIDLVIAEDLGRVMRDLDVVKFCGFAEDFDTRVIAINDYVDTAEQGWGDLALMSAWSHAKNNEHTSQRIKRSLGNRFSAEGKVFQCEIFGYIKPANCQSEGDVKIDLAATALYDKWFKMLEDGASFAEVADWLNSQSIPVGPYCRRSKWDGTMVGRITRNPILKGVRERNRFHTRKHHTSGHRVSVRAPLGELKIRSCPHLVHVDPARYDRVIAMLKERNACFRRKGTNGRDLLLHRPKKRTRWPGQHCYCGVCGRMLVYGGHGQNEYLVCSGTSQYKCWCGVSFDSRIGARKMIEQIVAKVESLPEFDWTFLNKIRQEMTNADGNRAKRLVELDGEIATLLRERGNVIAAIRHGDPVDALLTELKRIEQQVTSKEQERNQMAAYKAPAVNLPIMAVIKAKLHKAIAEVPTESPEFARLMKRLIPRISVFPYQSLDGSRAVMRARFTLCLASLTGETTGIDSARQKLQFEMGVDLFEPPQRIAILPAVQKELSNGTRSPKQIAEKLGVVDTVVQRSISLIRMMQDRGLCDCYQALKSPPDDDRRMRRHRHPRYHFEPLSESPTERSE